MIDPEPPHEPAADPAVRCRTAERNTAIAGVLLTLAIATAIALASLLGRNPGAAAGAPPTAAPSGSGSSPSGQGRAATARREATEAQPPLPQLSEDPGGSARGSGDPEGAGGDRGAAQDSFGFTVGPSEEHAVSGNESAADFATDEGGGSDGDGGIGNGEGGGIGDGRGVGEFMGLAATGRRIVFVIDRSGSMAESDRIYHTKLELKRTIETLGEDHEFLVVLFNTAAEPMPGGKMVRADERGKSRVFRWLNSLDGDDVFGGTDPAEAMRLALAARPDTVFLMTDGQFEPEPTMNALRAAGVGDEGAPVINTIAFHLRDGEATLMEIARVSNGRYRYVPPAGSGSDGEGRGAAP